MQGFPPDRQGRGLAKGRACLPGRALAFPSRKRRGRDLPGLVVAAPALAPPAPVRAAGTPGPAKRCGAEQLG